MAPADVGPVPRLINVSGLLLTTGAAPCWDYKRPGAVEFIDGFAGAIDAPIHVPVGGHSTYRNGSSDVILAGVSRCY